MGFNKRSYYTVLYSDIVALSQADKDELFDKDYGGSEVDKGIVMETSIHTIQPSLITPKECILECFPRKLAELIKFLNARSIFKTVFTHGAIISELAKPKWAEDIF